jgi:hypothetical protein
VSWADDAAPARTYDGVDAFVTDWLAPTYRRSFDTGGRAWCAQWREHPEAVSRLTGLWLAWEHLAGADGGTGLSTWWLAHCDPTMTVLMADDGPFKRCARGHTDRLAPLPVS